jgi:hypothetical protein
MNQATPPSDARFAKVRLTGCHTSSTTAGSTWFDNILVRLADYQVPVLEVISASGTWTCPNNVTRVRVRMWGGGGGGLSRAAAAALAAMLNLFRPLFRRLHTPSRLGPVARQQRTAATRRLTRQP